MAKKKKKEEVFYRFSYYGDANTLERWWNKGFTNDVAKPNDRSVWINLTRGVPESEAHIRMGNGHKLINEIIGDIREPVDKITGLPITKGGPNAQ